MADSVIEDTYSNSENKQDLKRPAEEPIQKEAKIAKLDDDNTSDTTTNEENKKEDTSDNIRESSEAASVNEESQSNPNATMEDSINNNKSSDTNDEKMMNHAGQSKREEQHGDQQLSLEPTPQSQEQQAKESQEKQPEPLTTAEQDGTQVQTNPSQHPHPHSHPHPHAILNITNTPPVPPGMHLLNESQQHQIIQQYVHAQGHDLANFTAASLAQAMVAPIAVPALASNLLQFQNGAVITALPGPPSQLPQPAAIPHPMPEDAQGSKRQSTRNMTNDERRQRRLLRNRQAAKECRKKKKQHIHDMEEKIVQLEQQNALLQKEVEELKNKLNIAAMQGTEGYRLMKEVEELNAKLSMGNIPNTAATMAASSTTVAHPVTTDSSPASVNSSTNTNKANDATDTAMSSQTKVSVIKEEEQDATCEGPSVTKSEFDKQENSESSLSTAQGKIIILCFFFFIDLIFIEATA
ncbi:hypothetical protein RMATCC62417_05483 [Rhizopus microsporus]|nr:hypothetical protein RMATCC62417_05483 [Rhizopus microsporus]